MLKQRKEDVTPVKKWKEKNRVSRLFTRSEEARRILKTGESSTSQGAVSK